MRTIYTLCLIFISNSVFAQFAIITDKDGFCNIRSSPNTGDNIIDTLKNGHFVYCFEPTGNWIYIDYTKNNKQHYDKLVYRNRLKYISEYQKIPQSAKTNNSISFSKDSLTIIVTQQKFDKNRYRFTYNKTYKDQIELINNKPYWGPNYRLPISEYKSIEIFRGAKKIVLPKNAIENLFEPTLQYGYAEVNYDQKNDIIYIQASNSDGGCAYQVIWKIEKGVYKEKYITSGF